MYRYRLHGFTLIELLVVIAILSLLVSILMPSLNRAKFLAKNVICQSNSHQIGIAMVTYTSDFRDMIVVKCGRHKNCEIGGLYMMLGDATKELTVTKEMFTRWKDDSATAAAIDAAAEKLKKI